jgi:hypothetical protein
MLDPVPADVDPALVPDPHWVGVQRFWMTPEPLTRSPTGECTPIVVLERTPADFGARIRQIWRFVSVDREADLR